MPLHSEKRCPKLEELWRSCSTRLRSPPTEGVPVARPTQGHRDPGQHHAPRERHATPPLKRARQSLRRNTRGAASPASRARCTAACLRETIRQKTPCNFPERILSPFRSVARCRSSLPSRTSQDLLSPPCRCPRRSSADP